MVVWRFPDEDGGEGMFNREKMQKLENAWKNWDARVQKELEKTPEQPLLFETISSIPVK